MTLYITKYLLVIEVRTTQNFREYEQLSFLPYILLYRNNDTKFAFYFKWLENISCQKFTKFCMIITGTIISISVKQLSKLDADWKNS